MRVAAVLLPALMSIEIAGGASAGTLTVWPVGVTLRTDGKPQVVNVVNEGDAGSLVQVEAYAWDDNVEIEAMEATRDLLAVPPVFEVAAHSSQVIRIALRRPMEADREASYRLVITEVPREVGPPGTISFVIRLNLPVFVTPDGALPQPVWSLQQDGGGAKLTLANEGNAHVRVQSIALFEDGGAQPVFVSDDGGYVLAGASAAGSSISAA